MSTPETSKAPIITSMQVVPVAGHDGMLLNLSGAHGPFFTRNIVILKDNAGHTGVVLENCLLYTSPSPRDS